MTPVCTCYFLNKEDGKGCQIMQQEAGKWGCRYRIPQEGGDRCGMVQP